MFTLDRFITADGRGAAWWGVSGCRTELEKMLDEPGSPRRQVRQPTAAKEAGHSRSGSAANRQEPGWTPGWGLREWRWLVWEGACRGGELACEGESRNRIP